MSSRKEKQKRERRAYAEQQQAERTAQAEEAARQRSAVGLSELPDFGHADFEGVVLGPRRALTLTLVPLIWIGNQGLPGPAVTVRIGGIVNFEEVEALFAAGHHKRSELGWLNYDEENASKPHDLYLRLAFERVDSQVVIHCHSLTITN